MKLVTIIASLMLLGLNIQAEEPAKAAEPVVATPSAGAGAAKVASKISKKPAVVKKAPQGDAKPAEGAGTK